jgi:hypothetical protein
MIEVPKLVAILVVGFLVWYAMRWVNGTQPKARPRRPTAPPPPRQQAVEDLIACRVCGAYVAPSARYCGKPGCPQPR